MKKYQILLISLLVLFAASVTVTSCDIGKPKAQLIEQADVLVCPIHHENEPCQTCKISDKPSDAKPPQLAMASDIKDRIKVVEHCSMCHDQTPPLGSEESCIRPRED